MLVCFWLVRVIKYLSLTKGRRTGEGDSKHHLGCDCTSSILRKDYQHQLYLSRELEEEKVKIQDQDAT